MKYYILTRPSYLTIALIAFVAYLFSSPAPVGAQYWEWPWEQDQAGRAPPPSQPLPAYPSPDQENAGNRVFNPRDRAPICLRLEERLAAVANQGGQLRSQLPEIEKAIQVAQRDVRRAERSLDRSDCYEQFLFARSLRRTPTCLRLDRTTREASRKLAALRTQHERILARGERSYQDDIIRELAANNCGSVYNREAQRRNPFSSFWEDEDNTDGRGFSGNTFAGLPFATYRTVCVRLCDGFYFPVSFSTLPTYFGRDAEACQSRCAAPAQLYFYQNPGQSVDQMVSLRTQQSYTKLKTAFRYRKEYVSGCSCKTSEYLSETARFSSDKSNGALPAMTLQPAPAVDATSLSEPVERGELSPIPQ